MKRMEKEKKRSDALARAQAKYAATQKQVMVRFSTVTEADLIAKLEKQPSMQAYIKRLIAEDLRR